MSGWRTIWVGGSDPGVQVVDVDPPLAPGEVEVDLSDLDDDITDPFALPIALLDDVALGDLETNFRRSPAPLFDRHVASRLPSHRRTNAQVR